MNHHALLAAMRGLSTFHHLTGVPTMNADPKVFRVTYKLNDGKARHVVDVFDAVNRRDALFKALGPTPAGVFELVEVEER